MNTIIQFAPTQFQNIYDKFLFKKRERFETILEPFQAILQLSLLAYCPIGTKLSIHQNILKIQLPNLNQGLLRWYQNDTKEDLFYLFHACKRFTHFYQHLKQIKLFDDFGLNTERNNNTNENEMNEIIENNNLYDLIIENTKKGVNKLIETYNNSDKISLLHTLQMYKLLLENPNYFNDFNKINITKNNSRKNSIDIDDNKSTNTNISYEDNIKKEIDEIFLEIRNIYSIHDYKVIFHSLKILEDKSLKGNEIIQKIECINLFLKSKEVLIKSWINDNIVF